MISKNKIKLIHSLKQKKHRDNERLFIAEGPKVVSDLIDFFPPTAIFCMEQWISNNHRLIGNETEINIVSEEELRKISQLQNPQKVLALFSIEKYNNKFITKKISSDKLSIALDGIQDPGNLGTIIRIADWFGIENIICSNESADVFNPKVIQATMGSIARVNVFYTNLYAYLNSLPEDFPIYATLLDGENVYKKQLTSGGIIVMGNEGNGISPEIKKIITNKLYIPTFQTSTNKADSLNVAVATAIVCSEFRRNLTLQKI
ncbi:MAG: RNA methyltransferase [Prevotella sp.]|nr:RNA methyltransferase [Prevotella sp.]